MDYIIRELNDIKKLYNKDMMRELYGKKTICKKTI